MANTIPVEDSWGIPIGAFDCTGYSRLPAIINWQGRTFQRYGRVNAYRYIEEPVTVVDVGAITLAE